MTEELKMELRSEEAKDIVRSYLNEDSSGEQSIAGAIFDRDQALDFLQWMMSPEAKEIGRKLREKRAQRRITQKLD